MNTAEIIDVVTFRDDVDITYPDSIAYTIKVNYKTTLFGEHQWRGHVIDREFKCVCDYTLNQDILWEALFENEIENGVLSFIELSRLYVKKIEFNKLTPETFKEIIDKNAAYFARLKTKYDEIKILKELRAI